MQTAMPGPGDEPLTPQDIARGIEQLEAEANAHLPNTPHPPTPAVRFGPREGDTRRVRRLRAQVAEAHALADLQQDETIYFLDTDRVRRHRRRAEEAARLHALAQDPAMRAWRAMRMRRLLVACALVALALALGWSTAGVQVFAAEGAQPWTPKWVFAWLVEPFMSIALLVVVGARAFMGTQGQPIQSPTLVRIEWLFLALTLGMNAFPYLPGVADEFSFPRLVLHILGPIVAVAIVTALPIILAAFTTLDVGLPSRGESQSSSRQNARSQSGWESGWCDPDDIEIKANRIRALIAAGELPPTVGVERIRRALRCSTATARAVRDRLVGDGGQQ